MSTSVWSIPYPLTISQVITSQKLTEIEYQPPDGTPGHDPLAAASCTP